MHCAAGHLHLMAPRLAPLPRCLPSSCQPCSRRPACCTYALQRLPALHSPPWGSGWRVALDIAEALAFLHSRHTLHADLKPRWVGGGWQRQIGWACSGADAWPTAVPTQGLPGPNPSTSDCIRFESAPQASAALLSSPSQQRAAQPRPPCLAVRSGLGASAGANGLHGARRHVAVCGCTGRDRAGRGRAGLGWRALGTAAQLRVGRQQRC